MQTRLKRLALVLLLGLVLIACTITFLFFRYVRPVGTGPAGPFIARDAFSQPWTSRHVLLVGLGDSVTAGFGARKGYSYFDRLTQNPPDEYPELKGVCLHAVFSNFASINLAISGSTSSEVPMRQLTLLATNDPKVLGIVVMTTGGNDIIHNYGRTPPREEAMYGAALEEAKPWVENFGRRLEDTVTQIKNRFPGGCEIFMATIFDPTDGVGDAERAGLPPWKDAAKILDAYNDEIHKCASLHPEVHLVDIHGAFLGHGIHCTQFWQVHYDRYDPHYWYYYNLEDPNERGYDVIRRLFLIEFEKAKNRLN
jgi:lysophospholipase L1-like esterase